MTRLPIFPLGTLVVPGGLLPLQVFEPRYLQMLADLIDLPEPQRIFGVVAIRRGHEVGAERSGELFPVGTAVVIEQLRPAGQVVVLLARGLCRFRVDSVDADRSPYLLADATWLAELPGDEEGARRLAGQVLTAYRRYAVATGGPPLPTGLEKDADSSDVAYAVLDRLELPLPERQDVLAAATTSEQLATLARLLHRESEFARRFGAVPAQPPPGGASLN